jgi:hypothetical protein
MAVTPCAPSTSCATKKTCTVRSPLRPLLCRILGEIDAACLQRLDATRAGVRARVWDLIAARHGRIPAAQVPSGDLGEQIVLRVDAHFIDATSNN